MALSLGDIQRDPIANRALNELSAQAGIVKLVLGTFPHSGRARDAILGGVSQYS
jgi:nucleotide-binding universal stress UspA family protein